MQWFLASGWVHTYRVSGLSAPVQKQAEVSLILDQVLDAVVASKRFKKRHGRDYIFPSTLPTIRDRVCKRSPLSQQLVLEGVMCGLRNKLLLREWHLVPYSARATWFCVACCARLLISQHVLYFSLPASLACSG